MKNYYLPEKFKINLLIYTLISTILIFVSCDNILKNEESNKMLIESNEIKIGNQMWMTSNLDVDTFRNGEKISEAKSKIEWHKAFKSKTPVWCYYDFKPENGKKYGKIYNWYAIIDSNGLAPNEWRIPFEKDWRKLFEYLGGEDSAGISLKSSTGWNLIDGKGNGNNSSGFNATPGGLLQSNFREIGNGAYYWGSIEKASPLSDISDKVVTSLYYKTDSVECTFTTDDGGFYVRCIKY